MHMYYIHPWTITLHKPAFHFRIGQIMASRTLQNGRSPKAEKGQPVRQEEIDVLRIVIHAVHPFHVFHDFVLQVTENLLKGDRARRPSTSFSMTVVCRHILILWKVGHFVRYQVVQQYENLPGGVSAGENLQHLVPQTTGLL